MFISNLLLILFIILLCIVSYLFLFQLREQCKLLNIRDICIFEDLICGKRDFLEPLTEGEIQECLTSLQLSLLPVGEDWICVWYDKKGKQYVLARDSDRENTVTQARHYIGKLGAKKSKLVHKWLADKVSKAEILRQLMIYAIK